jgi:hypothetical protein
VRFIGPKGPLDDSAKLVMLALAGLYLVGLARLLTGQ